MARFKSPRHPVSRTPRPAVSRSAEPLYREIRAVLESARAGAHRAVNAAMVQAYWHVGRLIVEHEQGGTKRAAYGEAVLDDLSRRLMAEFGRGFDVTNLRKMRQFYRMFEIRDAVRLESGKAKRAVARLVSGVEPIRHTAGDKLSWSHYRLLIQVESLAAREWYMNEAMGQHWSTRQLDRQISALYYERLLVSRKKAPVRKEAREKLAAVTPEQFIRDPYVLGFLDLKDYPALHESAIEQAIIDNLQAFLLELGKGFSFVASAEADALRGRRFLRRSGVLSLPAPMLRADRSQGRQAHPSGHRPDGLLRAYVRCPCTAQG